jgi:hypothetical protein
VHVGLDGVDVLLLLLGRIGVVEAQMALAGEFLGDAEIERDRLGMADMQIAVRLRRKPGDDASVLFRIEVGLDDVADEVAPCLGRYRSLWSLRVPDCWRPFCHPTPAAKLLGGWRPTSWALFMPGSCYTPPPFAALARRS